MLFCGKQEGGDFPAQQTIHLQIIKKKPEGAAKNEAMLCVLTEQRKGKSLVRSYT